MTTHLGEVVRLQVQRDSIKSGMKPYEQYTPYPNLQSVRAIRMNSNGVTGIAADGTMLPDVHNRSHPHSKFRGNNGISIMFTSHYAAMREKFGEHLVDGIAGEVMLVSCTDIISLEDLRGGLRITSACGDVCINGWDIAHPCAPFARYCLNLSEGTKPDRRITDALQFLEHGMRGFLAILPFGSDEIRISVGDQVWLPS